VDGPLESISDGDAVGGIEFRWAIKAKSTVKSRMVTPAPAVKAPRIRAQSKRDHAAIGILHPALEIHRDRVKRDLV